MYILITVLLALLAIIMTVIVFLPTGSHTSNDQLLTATAPSGEDNTPPTPCVVNYYNYCRQGWKKGSNQYGAGGVQWTINPPGCASEFDITISNPKGTVTETAKYNLSNTRMVPGGGISGFPVSMYSYAIQGRTNLNKLGGASAFRDGPTYWTITPKNTNTPFSSILFTMDTDSKDSCGSGSIPQDYYYCPSGTCN